MTDQEILDETHYCEVHPDQETELRCNKCGRYMCAKCAVQTPIGYRCRECVHQVEDRFFTATPTDVYIILAVSFGASIIAGALMSLVNFWLLGALLGFPVGGAIAELALRAVQRRRGRNSAQIIAGGIIAGGLLGAAIRSYLAYPKKYAQLVDDVRQSGINIPIPNEYTHSGYVIEHTLTIGLILFIAMAAYAAYYRMKS